MIPSTDNTPEQRPTGNLEDLFRQKFADAELTPRADVWERLDHDLLVRQNEGYRRRLGVWRWAAAAACAVATLSGGAWLTQQGRSTRASSEVAAVATLRETIAPNAATEPVERRAAAEAETTQGLASASSQPMNSGLAAGTAAEQGFAQAGAEAAQASEQGVNQQRARAAMSGLGSSLAASGSQERAIAGMGRAAGTSSVAAGFGSRSEAAYSGADAVASLAGLRMEADLLNPVAASLRGGAGFGRPDSLKAFLHQAPPMLAFAEAPGPQAEDDKHAPAARNWRWRGGYSASRFVPNFAVSSVSVADAGFPAVTNSPSMSRPAKFITKTVPVLAAGIAHRGQLGGSLQVGKRWSIVTGGEVASIAGNTTVEENPTNLYPNGTPMVAYRQPAQRAARYHFATAGVPVQARYSGQKSGWSVYAAVGAAVNVLLRNRLEADGQEVADEVSYNRLLASARGDMGVQFASAKAPWKFMIGPEAEVGLNTLNANASGTWLERTKPYSIGLAASVEFGARKPDAQP
ncbi:hypothetical protein F0P96_15635 [Hymenobacter busanensis]|uniref:Uncharacterized protein n=1 Tax=Hymenobacter busanensis TaxID=2607656 RepID=A0A7L5A1D3_9BACT|nr:hypothetical protein [Hymenobacter busanensis]KAA9331663.1 hypothetical protein F0P96_15635 [Hymenobacter busanensis]QHJ08815.1 hypothetical protein GUY19_16575 [Hymenobacter busanensis]